jgi:lysophospholipase L1-like esterase
MRHEPEPGKTDPTLMHPFFIYPDGYWIEAEDIEVTTSAAVAREYPNVTLVDLATEYHRQTKGWSRKEYESVGYITSDGVHFTPRGNALLADLLAMRLKPLL